MHILVCINFFLMHVRKLCSSGDGKVGEGFAVRAAGLVQCREQSTALREPVGLQKGRGRRVNVSPNYIL